MSLSKPATTFSDDFHRFDWEEEQFSATLERFVEERSDVRTELTVTSSHPTRGGQLYFGRLLLLGPAARRDVVRHLNDREGGVDWQAALEQICTLSLRRYREGEPAIDLATAELGAASRYLVRPFVFDDALNLIYGSGDSGKSLFALALGLAIATGQEVAGLVAERTGPVLYLDWEDSAQTHQERLRGLARGVGVPLGGGSLIYRRMTASLKESAREVRKDIGKNGAIAVIADSIGMACGGDPSDATAIIQTMIAARSLNVPVIGIHHIAKDAKDKANPYGSVYATNEARMSWYVQSERAQNQLSAVLTNYKANRGARHERQAFRFSFTEDEHEAIERIDITSLTFGQSKEVGDSGQKWKIAQYLGIAGATSVNAISAALDIPKATVRAQLNRHTDLFVRVGENWASVTASETPADAVTPSFVPPGEGTSLNLSGGRNTQRNSSETVLRSETESKGGPKGPPSSDTPPWNDEEARIDSLVGI